MGIQIKTKVSAKSFCWLVIAKSWCLQQGISQHAAECPLWKGGCFVFTVRPTLCTIYDVVIPMLWQLLFSTGNPLSQSLWVPVMISGFNGFPRADGFKKAKCFVSRVSYGSSLRHYRFLMLPFFVEVSLWVKRMHLQFSFFVVFLALLFLSLMGDLQMILCVSQQPCDLIL